MTGEMCTYSSYSECVIGLRFGMQVHCNLSLSCFGRLPHRDGSRGPALPLDGRLGHGDALPGRWVLVDLSEAIAWAQPLQLQRPALRRLMVPEIIQALHDSTPLVVLPSCCAHAP